MLSASKLEPYQLSGSNLELVEKCFSEQESEPLIRTYKQRPKPSELRNRVSKELLAIDFANFQPYPSQMIEAVLRSVNRAWDDFHEGSVSPNEFMRATIGASYEIVEITGKGRGIIANRDIEAGEVILKEAPVLLLPPPPAVSLLLLTLPQKALEAILLLHNAHPEEKKFSADRDIPKHRLLDYLSGVLSTNSFGALSDSCGPIGILLLTGSLFNHSGKPNLVRNWDNATEKQVFKSTRGIKKGEELEVDYVPGQVGKSRADHLKYYGSGLS